MYKIPINQFSYFCKPEFQNWWLLTNKFCSGKENCKIVPQNPLCRAAFLCTVIALVLGNKTIAMNTPRKQYHLLTIKPGNFSVS